VCTVVVDFVPGQPMPLLLLGVRDELTGRPWQPPARHWTGSPLVGGLDEQAGGTWLAVHPAERRVACILNARGPQAPPDTRRSRGELPLRAAASGLAALPELAAQPSVLASYDPFILVCADASADASADVSADARADASADDTADAQAGRPAVLVLTWNGQSATLEDLMPATHVFTNAGHMYPAADPQHCWPRSAPDAKAAHFGPKFAAHRPSGDPATTIKDAWGDWLTLADGDGLSVTDPAAIIARRELPDGRLWGSTSVSLVALGPGGLRYDFQPVPGDAPTWYPVAL
jgi:Transport and Golgi organisation 2